MNINVGRCSVHLVLGKKSKVVNNAPNNDPFGFWIMHFEDGLWGYAPREPQCHTIEDCNFRIGVANTNTFDECMDSFQWE